MHPKRIKSVQKQVRLQPGAKTGRAARWAYGYADLSALLGLTEGSLRNRVSKGWEPTLEAVVTAVVERRRREQNVCKPADSL